MTEKNVKGAITEESIVPKLQSSWKLDEVKKYDVLERHFNKLAVVAKYRVLKK